MNDDLETRTKPESEPGESLLGASPGASRSRHVRWIVAVLLVAAIGAVAWYRHSGQSASGPESQAAAAALRKPPAVTVSHPLEKQVTEWDEYTGQFQAVDYVAIRARVSGYLTEIHFIDGQWVKQGDLLFVIDPRPFQIDL